jgi:hypothetical protein
MGKSWRKSATRTGSKKRKRSPAMAERRAKRVYDWEGEWYHWSIPAFRSIHGPRKWVRWALNAYNVPEKVTVRDRAKPYRNSIFRPADWSIHLLQPHWNVPSALHEAAHAIHYYYYGDDPDHHGKKWLGIYVWLLCQTTLVPCSAIKASLAEAGLDYSHMMTPKVLKRKTPASIE